MENTVMTLSTNQTSFHFKNARDVKNKKNKNTHTQTNNKYYPNKYNNKYLNMTSICAKTQIRLNEIFSSSFLKKKNSYIRYTTTYWKANNWGRVTTTTAVGLKCIQCSPVTCCCDNADTTDAKAPWKQREPFSRWPMSIVMHVFCDHFSPELEHALVQRCIYIK